MKGSYSLVALVSLLTTVPLEAQTPLPKWTLTAGRDSFVMSLRGEAKGYTVLAVEPLADGGFRVTEHTQIGAAVDQKTMILLDADHQLKRVMQSAKARGQDLRIDLNYGNGRVQGSAVTPAQGGTQSQTIDSEIPANAVDDNLVQSLLAALPWSEQSHWVMPVFSAGKNGLTDMILKVQAIEPVSVPAGTQAAYKIEMRGDVVAVQIWISKSTPHRLLKMVPIGSPMEIVRAN